MARQGMGSSTVSGDAFVLSAGYIVAPSVVLAQTPYTTPLASALKLALKVSFPSTCSNWDVPNGGVLHG
jgi:hypothetical protein